jgi:hypothetical protein
VITNLISAVAIIFSVVVVWALVQHFARAYAARHPEFGPYREDGDCGHAERDCSGCGLVKRGCPTGPDEQQNSR